MHLNLLTKSQEEMAKVLVRLHEQYPLGNQIAIYFDDVNTCIYPLRPFSHWLFIPRIEKEDVRALALEQAINFEYNVSLNLHVITFRPKLFTLANQE